MRAGVSEGDMMWRCISPLDDAVVEGSGVKNMLPLL